ncbi:MAG: ribonuclease HI family protein [Patescibacteria group bacterium]|nr:ribonuclease HI family protein [Patescibacteria group bacterium]
MHDKITIYSDGGARGNPGPAGIGAVVEIQGKMREISKYIGEATNNVAEYRALIEALCLAKTLAREKGLNLKKERVECYLDSELVVRQLKGEYRVKDVKLRRLFEKLRNFALEFSMVNFNHITREFNKRADRLVNEALDSAVKK